MSRMMSGLLALAMVCLSAGWLQAAEKTAAKAPATKAPAAEVTAPKAGLGENIKNDFGADLRVRQVYFDNIPIVADPPGITRSGDNHFFRVRTRVFDKLDLGENLSVYGRLCNEFRMYDKPHNLSSDWPDEWVVDNLYLDVKNDAFDLRIGRQDLIYGTGKVMLEGTPKDGSRTIYMDAIKLSLKQLVPDTTVDLLGINNEPENELVIDSQERDLTGQTSAYDDITERGGGIYAKNKSIENMPAELYYFYKEETEWSRPNGTNPPIDIAALELHTVGFRLTPKWSDMVDANIECAFQSGERGDQDVQGSMVDALFNCHPPVMEDLKPCVAAGVYYLSGNDPDTAKDEGWNPLWGRWPQYSELYIYAYDADGAGRWSNVMMPHVDLSLKGNRWLNLKAMVGYLEAPENNGPGEGTERGWLFVLRNDFVVKEGLLLASDKLFGHLLLEVLEPGDYYNVDDTAYFARWELSYAF